MPYDDDIIVEMGRHNCEQTCAPDVFSEERARQLLAGYHEEANPTFFVVEGKGRKVLGFLAARMMAFDHRAGFYTAQSILYVSPENRGSRAAVLLMKHFIDWSVRIGAAAIMGGNDNSFQTDRTTKFLEHFGFEHVGNMMRKRL